jgi:hypothetical protein
MGPCNSHKCHCPHCLRTRRIIEESNRADREQELRDEQQRRRLEQQRFGQQRRDAWKRLARQHHVDQAGVCCAPEEFCTCPNCIETREFYTIRSGEWIEKIHTSVDTSDYKTGWVWARRGRGWRRKNIATKEFFGPLVRYVDPSALAAHYIRTRTVGSASIRDEFIIREMNPGSDSWVKARFADAGAYMSREQATELYRRYYGLDTPWADPQSKSDLLTPEVRASFLHGDWSDKKEHPLTQLQFAVLFFYAAFPNSVWSRSGPACGVHEAHLWLINNEFLKVSSVGYQVTERAKVLLDAAQALPLPIRKPAPWTMPV